MYMYTYNYHYAYTCISLYSLMYMYVHVVLLCVCVHGGKVDCHLCCVLQALVLSKGTQQLVLRKAMQTTRPEWHPPWKLMRVISGHLGWVRCIAVEPGNEWFATGSSDRTIKVLYLYVLLHIHVCSCLYADIIRKFWSEGFTCIHDY